MNLTLENATAAVGLPGIGGILGNYFRVLWERRSSELKQKHEFKETRYKCVIILMYGALDFDNRARGMNQHGRAFTKASDVLDELAAEWHNMVLFASNEVLRTVRVFISSPSQDAFWGAAEAMRDDLWGGRLSVDLRRLVRDSVGEGLEKTAD